MTEKSKRIERKPDMPDPSVEQVKIDLRIIEQIARRYEKLSPWGRLALFEKLNKPAKTQ